ncbi:unnamed protein product [Rotaria sp. Silwood2]|nr:unnamed protein product [Rotaria sp. Silwood2]CAF4391400.1 unnamed protein product [Rotaria sp. Silwood2]
MFLPDCRDRPNGNYVDQYRSNCQYHYTCLGSRTFNYTSCEIGFRFSVQHQKCLPAKQIRQKLLISSILIEKFQEMISDIGTEYFTHIELDYLEEIKLIDIDVFVLLLK